MGKDLENVLVSACLLAIPCRYDGRVRCDFKEELKDKCNIIPVCPEQLGGLPTPRIPSEIVKDRIISKEGKDVTDNYNKGAEAALVFAKINNCKYAFLKSDSPSCGCGRIYDGSFSGIKIKGDGNTTKLLKENGIKVYSELEIEDFLKEINNR